MPTSIGGTLAVLIDDGFPADLGRFMALGTDVDMIPMASVADRVLHHDTVLVVSEDLATAGQALRTVALAGGGSAFLVVTPSSDALEEYDGALAGLDSAGILVAGSIRAIRVVPAREGRGALGRTAWLEATTALVPSLDLDQRSSSSRAERVRRKSPAKRGARSKRARQTAPSRAARLLRKRYVAAGALVAVVAATTAGWLADGVFGAVRDAIVVSLLALIVYVLLRVRALMMSESAAAARFRAEERRVRTHVARRDRRAQQILSSIDDGQADTRVITNMILESLREPERRAR